MGPAVARPPRAGPDPSLRRTLCRVVEPNEEHSCPCCAGAQCSAGSAIASDPLLLAASLLARRRARAPAE
eukprot:9487095-Pyramimonas_sp.AAC.1